MSKLVIALIAIGVTSSALAQEGAARMSREELLSFLPGTKVTHMSETGSSRTWTNEPDGKFVISSDNKKYGSVMGTQSATARGTWMVNDTGRYCVDTDWKRVNEKWCAYILKGPDGAFYLNTADAAHKIGFAR